MLGEYLPVRNPILLIRDNVINRYFIEVAPEISEMEKALWNKKATEKPEISLLKLQHEMVIYADEIDIIGLPSPQTLIGNYSSQIVQPIIYQQQGLPLCVLSMMVTDNNALNNIQKIAKFISDILSVSMVARGFPTTNIVESTPEERDEIPRIIDDIIGKSDIMLHLAKVIKKVATSKATVLIRGESGTGKELIAKAIHNNSLYRKAPFISINCAALADNLLESELFGHEKGAFTGAITARKGRFEQADGGTLFLDEIGDTSLQFQRKILRVLQEGQFERLGGDQTIHVDVRILCATNVNLEKAIAEGVFREDLYYRLNVIRLDIPALRERTEDIPLLIEYFLDRLNCQEQKNITVSSEDLELLKQFPWYGNIRELENMIHSAFLMEQGGQLSFGEQLKTVEVKKTLPLRQSASWEYIQDTEPEPLAKEEIIAIENALREVKGVQVKAAELLGISLRQLRYRIKKYQIVVRKIQK
jgi:Nif-specific regulatory protein